MIQRAQKVKCVFYSILMSEIYCIQLYIIMVALFLEIWIGNYTAIICYAM